MIRHPDVNVLLKRSLESLKDPRQVVQAYYLVDNVQRSLDLSTQPPCPDLLGQLVRHVVANHGEESDIRQGLAAALYSALRSDDRKVPAALLDAGVDPNWQPDPNSNFPTHAVMSLLSTHPPCSLDEAEVFERLRMVAAAGTHFQQVPNPTHRSMPLIAWPLSGDDAPSAYQFSLANLMIELEWGAGREVLLENCIADVMVFQRERIVPRLAPMIAEVSARKMDAAVALPILNHPGAPRF